jgi:hypothetical protein
MDYDSVVAFIQGHFSDGLALVIGSGLSAAEGIAGMPAIASRLNDCSSSLTGKDANHWIDLQPTLRAEGLEAALLKHPPSETLELWIVRNVASLLLPQEKEVVGAVIRGDRVLRLTTFLSRVLHPNSGLPILTPNYDRLIEVACEMAGFHVDTTAIGQYAGAFDHVRSCMGSCKGIASRAKTTVLDHYPRAIVLKPHGSFDWYRIGGDARRCSIELDAERLIITPGLNKYRAGYDSPFDKHRDLANDYVKKAARLLIVGYGFNDDHLQTHLIKRIKDGTPTLILNRSINSRVSTLATESPRCVCLTKLPIEKGVSVLTKDFQFDKPGPDLWDLKILTEELLS